MKFRTEITIPGRSYRISHKTPLFLMGSCFSVQLAERLRNLKFPLTDNPFGILFNPTSLAAAFELLLTPRPFDQNDLRRGDDGLWHSFRHHGAFSAISPHEALEKMNMELSLAASRLPRADFLIITWGTAWEYRHRETGVIVANCHKFPAPEFSREITRVSNIVSRWAPILERLTAQQKSLQILLTVSPIRHIKDGLAQNSLSKSTLRLAVHELEKISNVTYFPAFELLLDDLRDYRYYAADLCHPSAEAFEYIWEKFAQAWIEQETLPLLREIQEILQATRHRPLHPETRAHQDFIQRQLSKIRQLENRYPDLDFSKEIRMLTSGCFPE
jgi:hypothetical protein